jgi:hypothetical protein
MKAMRDFVLVLIAVCGAAISAGATPITVGGDGGPALEVDPLYFAGWGVFGLSGPGTGPDYYATAPVTFLSVANAAGVDLRVTQQLQLPAIQFPQDPSLSMNPDTNGGTPTNATTALPSVVDSIWTVRNTSGRALDDVLFLLTRTVPQSGYPAVDVAVDDHLFGVLEYTTAISTRFYGAVPLGDLDPNETASFTMRYIVAGNIPLDGDEFVLPQLGAAALEGQHWVPEPTTALLLAFGLVSIAARRRTG